MEVSVHKIMFDSVNFIACYYEMCDGGHYYLDTVCVYFT